MQGAASIFSKMSWNPEVTHAINLFLNINGENGIWRDEIRWMDQDEDYHVKSDQNWQQCDVRVETALHLDPELASEAIRIKWNKGEDTSGNALLGGKSLRKPFAWADFA